jgi:protein disulfide-isomerase A1
LSSTLPGAVTARRKLNSYLSHDQCSLIPSLAPKYEELAQLYAANPSYAEKVKVAKVDATANDVPEEIQGFPTIKLYPAGSKDSPVDYSGPRTIEDLAQFIKVNGKHKIDVYASNDTNDDVDMPIADTTMPKQAPAATGASAVKEAVKSVTSEAAEVVKTMAVDNDEAGVAEHDEL